MPFGDALISFVASKVYDEFALFLKGVTKEDSNGGKGSYGDVNQMTKKLCLKNRK